MRDGVVSAVRAVATRDTVFFEFVRWADRDRSTTVVLLFRDTELASRTAALTTPTPTIYVTRKSTILFIPLYMDNMISNYVKKY